MYPTRGGKVTAVQMMRSFHPQFQRNLCSPDEGGIPIWSAFGPIDGECSRDPIDTIVQVDVAIKPPQLGTFWV